MKKVYILAILILFGSSCTREEVYSEDFFPDPFIRVHFKSDTSSISERTYQTWMKMMSFHPDLVNADTLYVIGYIDEREFSFNNNPLNLINARVDIVQGILKIKYYSKGRNIVILTDRRGSQRPFSYLSSESEDEDRRIVEIYPYNPYTRTSYVSDFL